MITNHIRLAKMEDLPRLVEFSKHFFQASPYRTMRFSREKTREGLKKIIEGNGFQSIILVALKDGEPVGFIVGSSGNPPFSDNLMSQEIAWWVEENHRGTRGALLLFQAYEDWAKRIGCSHVQGAYLPGVSPDLDNFYKKRGYMKTEVSYVKVLKV